MSEQRTDSAKPGEPGWVHRLDALCPFCGRRCGEHESRHEIGFHCSFPRSETPENERPCPCCDGTNYLTTRWECGSCKRQLPYRRGGEAKISGPTIQAQETTLTSESVRTDSHHQGSTGMPQPGCARPDASASSTATGDAAASAGGRVDTPNEAYSRRAKRARNLAEDIAHIEQTYGVTLIVEDRRPAEAKPGTPGWVHRLDAICPFCARRCGEHESRHEIGFHCSFPRRERAKDCCPTEELSHFEGCKLFTELRRLRTIEEAAVALSDRMRDHWVGGRGGENYWDAPHTAVVALRNALGARPTNASPKEGS